MNEFENEFDCKIKQLSEMVVSEISKSSKVFIVPHIDMDFDALASAAVLYTICKLDSKEVYIVSDDKEEMMRSGVKKIYTELKNKVTFITTDEVEKRRDKDELVILTDTNTERLIPITNIDTFKNIMIIDHHNTDTKTVKTDKVFIDTEMSSASEILFYLMKKLDFYIDTYLAQLMLTGLYLDTAELRHMKTPYTAVSLAKIISYGANLNETQDLFVISNFEDDRKKEHIINELIDCTQFSRKFGYKVAVTLNDNNMVYNEVEHLAEVADRCYKYSYDVLFVIGYIDREELGKGHKNLISIKARSKSNDINAHDIMALLGGGGDHLRASSTIQANNIEEIKDLVLLAMTPTITQEEVNEMIKLYNMDIKFKDEMNSNSKIKML